MALEIMHDSPIDREVYDRLFQEALPYISEERLRVGEEELRESMWRNLKAHETTERMYIQDGEVVGVSCVRPLGLPDGSTGMWYMHPTYGQTSLGSRAFFYSEDFQKVGKNWMDANGYDKVIVIHNPGSAAALAVEAIWGNSWEGRRYFNKPEVLTIDEAFGTEHTLDLPSTMRVFIIEKAS